MAQQIHEQADRTTRLVGAIIGCPECSGPAEVETTTMASTDGCVEHLKIQRREPSLVLPDR